MDGWMDEPEEDEDEKEEEEEAEDEEEEEKGWEANSGVSGAEPKSNFTYKS